MKNELSKTVNDNDVLKDAQQACNKIELAIARLEKATPHDFGHRITERNPRVDPRNQRWIEDGRKACGILRGSQQLFIRVLCFDDPCSESRLAYITDEAVGYAFRDQGLLPWTSREGAISEQLRIELESGRQPTSVLAKWSMRQSGANQEQEYKDYSENFEVFGLWNVAFSSRSIPAEVSRFFSTPMRDTPMSTFGLQSIVKTIDTVQRDIVRKLPNGVSIITGGPGVGKTTAAIHRIPYLINECSAIVTDNTPSAELWPEFLNTNQLVLVPQSHLIPYLSELLKRFVPDFPGDNLSTVDEWALAEAKRLFGIGMPGGWQVFEGDSDSERWKSKLRYAQLKHFVEFEVERTGTPFKSSPKSLLRFLLLPDVIDLLRSECKEFSADRFVSTIRQQHRERTMTKCDIYLLLNLVAAGTIVNRKHRHRTSMKNRLSRYSHIVVDEAQHVDPLILTLMPRLVRRGIRTGLVTICGDLDQRDEPSDHLMDWRDLDFGRTKPVFEYMTTAYRWSEEVFPFVKVVHKLMRIKERIETPRIWRVGGGLRPEIFCESDQDLLVESMIDRIRQLRSEQKTRNWRVAVFLRKKDPQFTPTEFIKLLANAGEKTGTSFHDAGTNSIVRTVDDVERLSGIDIDAAFFPLLPGFVFNKNQGSRDMIGRLWIAFTRAQRFMWLGLEANELDGSAVALRGFVVKNPNRI